MCRLLLGETPLRHVALDGLLHLFELDLEERVLLDEHLVRRRFGLEAHLHLELGVLQVSLRLLLRDQPRRQVPGHRVPDHVHFALHEVGLFGGSFDRFEDVGPAPQDVEDHQELAVVQAARAERGDDFGLVGVELLEDRHEVHPVDRPRRPFAVGGKGHAHRGPGGDHGGGNEQGRDPAAPAGDAP